MIALVLVWSVWGVAASAPSVAAQSTDLAERLPAGTLLYLGWSGCDQAGTAAKDTVIGQILADPQVKGFFGDLDKALDGFLKPMAADQIGPEGYAAARRMILDICRKPGALALIDVNLSAMGPAPRVAFILRLGERADAFVADLKSLLQAAPLPPAMEVPIAGKTLFQIPIPVPGGLYFGAVDGDFILAVGMATVEQLIALPAGEGESLANSAALTVPRAALGGDAGSRAVTLFIDLAGLLDRARTIVPVFVQDPERQEQIWGIVSAVGADNLRSICWEMHYRQRGCYNGVFLHTEGPPAGLLAIGSNEPLTKADLALIPKEPYWATIFSLNPGQIYADVLGLLERVDSRSHNEVRGTIAEAEEGLGLRIDRDLLDLIGPKITLYDAPANGGLWFTGTTLIVESTDAERLRGSIGKLLEVVAREVNDEEGRQRLGKPHLALGSTTYRDRTIEFVNLSGVPMPIAPAWAVADGRLIVALYPQMVQAALDRMAGDTTGDTLADNADFAAARKVLGGIGSTVTYLNTRRAAQQLYALALPLAQVGAAMAQGVGVDIDVAGFPTQQALTRHLFGHVATTQHTDQGILFASYGPLPFGVGSIGEGVGATSALTISVLLPSLSRARTLSKRIVSLSNLRGIYMACMIYANDQPDGRFPPDLATLIELGEIPAKQLQAPLDKTGEVSYVYLTPGLLVDHVTLAHQMIVAHERTDLNDGEGVNVIFADGHAEFVRTERFEMLLEQTKKELEKLQSP
ncbi:MAG: hypothetical protein IID40_03725 [Planctomycetes bacterium]|nr:hypothetical protein [Planctomycetota bacterium]